jgi:hypothetical protein
MTLVCGRLLLKDVSIGFRYNMSDYWVEEEDDKTKEDIAFGNPCPG